MLQSDKKICSLSADEALELLETNLNGLSSEEAKRRLAKHGTNDIQAEKNVPAWLIFVRQFNSPLILILVGASLLSYGLGDKMEVIMILSMVAMSTVLSFIQEYRSERSLRMLRKKLNRYATVMRNGKPQKIDARELVPGDIVRLELGTVVAADMRLLQIDDLEIDESMLTGESVPVAKTDEAIGEGALTPQEQINMAFMGTNVVEGCATAVVVATGSNTETGRTAALLATRTEETDFQKGVRAFGGFLIKVTVGLIALATIGMGLMRGNWIEAVLFALALAVGVSPELFPMIVTVNLSRGAIKMSKKHVMVKKLIAIEDLGNADVFCTDKTGTLTVGTLRVRGAINALGKDDDKIVPYAAQCLTLNSSGRATNAIDQAILDAASHEHAPQLIRNATRLETISFDFQRRRMSCVIENEGGQRWLISKGAVKETLAVCTHHVQDEKTYELTETDVKRINELADRAQDEGYRLLAVARREIGKQDTYTPKDEKNLQLVGFVQVSDAPKQTAAAALTSLEKLNVRIVILTGDTERVTRHVTKQLGFKITSLLTGDQLEGLDPAAFDQACEKANVFTGITPAQKLRVIQSLKKHGHTVGFMGDGVNDAPSLRMADVGISFDDAVDVAKEAASVILLKKNLSVLADGIREGRRTFANTQTYINATISSNFGNMLSLACVSLFLPFLPMLPAQILLLNILSDLPMLGISNDRVAEEDLAKPRSWNVGRISKFMYFFGPISSLADFATFGLLFFVVQANSNLPLFRSGWFVESLLTEVVVIFFMRSRLTTLKNLPSKILVVACFVSVGLAMALVYSPYGRDFEFAPIPVQILVFIIGIVAVYGLMVEGGKRLFYKYIDR